MSKIFRIFMGRLGPDQVQLVKQENRPLFFRVLLPRGARFLGCHGIPTLVDLLGMTGGGGPPGFAFFIDTDEVSDLVLLGFTFPETPLSVEPPRGTTLHLEPLGIFQTMGMLLGGFMITGDVRDIIGNLEKSGALITDTISYEVPHAFRSSTAAPPSESVRSGGEGGLRVRR